MQWDVSHFAIALAFSAFAAMWKAAGTHFQVVTIPRMFFRVLWGLALLILLIDLVLYIVRAIVFPPSIARDFANPRLVNFFFVPVIIGTLLVISVPNPIRNVPAVHVAYYSLAAYQLALAVYLYGEWLFGKQIIDVIHPVVFMQVIGFFLLSNLAASMRHAEEALALFAVGSLFWILIFVTNFQHTSSTMRRNSERPQPTFFLFIAPPAQAAIAAVLISVALKAPSSASGMLKIPNAVEWPLAAHVILYIDLFLYLLILRLFPTFWTNEFAVTWWAYIFPLSAAASATLVRYSSGRSTFWAVVSGLLSLIASIAMIVVSVATLWGLCTGRIPKNDAAVAAYREYKGEQFSSTTSRGGNRLNPSISVNISEGGLFPAPLEETISELSVDDQMFAASAKGKPRQCVFNR